MKTKRKKSTGLTVAEKFSEHAVKQRKQKNALRPIMSAAGLMHAYLTPLVGEVDIVDLTVGLMDECDKVSAGDLTRAETMLMAQAHALDAIFTNLARRGGMNAGEYMGACETYLKLALRAQAQCRATLEALAVMKNPSVVFAKQANIAHGPQQVNNGVTYEPAHVDETVKPPSKLLEQVDGKQRLDTRTESTAGKGDPVMAAVGTIHWPAHRTRKSHR